jgi:hypothetical protein
VVEQVIEKCHGGDPAVDVDCTLTLLLDQRFTVMDHLPPGSVQSLVLNVEPIPDHCGY